MAEGELRKKHVKVRVKNLNVVNLKRAQELDDERADGESVKPSC